MSEILAALAGAIFTGLFQAIDRIRQRNREAEAILTAIASEVDSICHLVRHQRYLELSETMARSIKEGVWDGATLVIEIRQNYFVAYEGLIEKIGLLKPIQVSKIVRFYSCCKSVIDSTYPDGVNSNLGQSELAAANLLSLNGLLRIALALGDEIVQMPHLAISVGHVGDGSPK